MIEKCKNLRFNLTNNMRDLIIEIVILETIILVIMVKEIIITVHLIIEITIAKVDTLKNH